MKENRKVRVAIVCGSMKIGGGEIMSAKLAGYIDRGNFEVKYFVISKYIDNQIAESLRKSETDFKCLELPNSFSFRSYKVFAQALKEFSPDVIHSNLDATYSWVWAILNNKPLITTIHRSTFVHRDKRVAAVIKLKSLQGKLRVIGCSKKTMELEKNFYRLKDSQMGYIYNPVSVEDFTPVSHQSEQIDFVAMGRLCEEKNYPLMLWAFKKVVGVHKNVHLSIAGSGALDAELRELASQLGIADMVAFLGNVQDVPSLLSHMDVLLLSSVSEACPMVILEAMASGLPVIATNVGGVPELVSDNGIIVQSGDADAFAAAMEKMIDEPLLRKNMGQKSRLYSSKFDKSAIADEYEQEYFNLVRRGMTS